MRSMQMGDVAPDAGAERPSPELQRLEEQAVKQVRSFFSIWQWLFCSKTFILASHPR